MNSKELIFCQIEKKKQMRKEYKLVRKIRRVTEIMKKDECCVYYYVIYAHREDGQ